MQNIHQFLQELIKIAADVNLKLNLPPLTLQFKEEKSSDERRKIFLPFSPEGGGRELENFLRRKKLVGPPHISFRNCLQLSLPNLEKIPDTAMEQLFKDFKKDCDAFVALVKMRNAYLNKLLNESRIYTIPHLKAGLTEGTDPQLSLSVDNENLYNRISELLRQSQMQVTSFSGGSHFQILIPINSNLEIFKEGFNRLMAYLKGKAALKNSETLQLNPIESVPLNRLFITSDGYAFDLHELKDCFENTNLLWHNPYTRTKLSQEDIDSLLKYSEFQNLERKKSGKDFTTDMISKETQVKLAELGIKLQKIYPETHANDPTFVAELSLLAKDQGFLDQEMKMENLQSTADLKAAFGKRDPLCKPDAILEDLFISYKTQLLLKFNAHLNDNPLDRRILNELPEFESIYLKFAFQSDFDTLIDKIKQGDIACLDITSKVLEHLTLEIDDQALLLKRIEAKPSSGRYSS